MHAARLFARLFLLLALLAGLAPVFAAEAGQDALVQQLTAQSAAWDLAIVRKDKAAIEANMAEDFRQIDGDGDLETKASFVAGLLSPKLVLDPYTVQEFELRLYGSTALLSGRIHMTGSYDGKRIGSHYRYIDVYVHQPDGQWRIVSVQLTRLPPAPL